MKSLLMINVPSGGPYQSHNWPARDVQAHNAYMQALTKQLEEAGELEPGRF